MLFRSGVGDKPGAIKPDGIERQVEELEKKALAPADAEAQAAALEKAAYVIAAIAASVADKCPKEKTKDNKTFKTTEKDAKNFRSNAESLQKAALEFAAAAKTKKPADIQKSAKALYNVCSKCHDEFK